MRPRKKQASCIATLPLKCCMTIYFYRRKTISVNQIRILLIEHITERNMVAIVFNNDDDVVVGAVRVLRSAEENSKINSAPLITTLTGST